LVVAAKVCPRVQVFAVLKSGMVAPLVPIAVVDAEVKALPLVFVQTPVTGLQSCPARNSLNLLAELLAMHAIPAWSVESNQQAAFETAGVAGADVSPPEALKVVPP
jgi:hypothetical protein